MGPAGQGPRGTEVGGPLCDARNADEICAYVLAARLVWRSLKNSFSASRHGSTSQPSGLGPACEPALIRCQSVALLGHDAVAHAEQGVAGLLPRDTELVVAFSILVRRVRPYVPVRPAERVGDLVVLILSTRVGMAGSVLVRRVRPSATARPDERDAVLVVIILSTRVGMAGSVVAMALSRPPKLAIGCCAVPPTLLRLDGLSGLTAASRASGLWLVDHEPSGSSVSVSPWRSTAGDGQAKMG